MAKETISQTEGLCKEVTNCIRNAYDRGYKQGRKDIIKELKEKTGHWLDTGSGQKCSRCGEIQYGYDSFRRFCASCGAKMIEPQESEGV